MKKIEDVNRETMLRAAHAHAKTVFKHARPLWAFVRDICCVGSSSAYAICRELGWDPDAKALSPLPPRRKPNV